jgi:hypothetical protein
MAALTTWYNSAEYQPLIPLRQSAVNSDTKMWLKNCVTAFDAGSELCWIRTNFASDETLAAKISSSATYRNHLCAHVQVSGSRRCGVVTGVPDKALRPSRVALLDAISSATAIDRASGSVNRYGSLPIGSASNSCRETVASATCAEEVDAPRTRRYASPPIGLASKPSADCSSCVALGQLSDCGRVISHFATSGLVVRPRGAKSGVSCHEYRSPYGLACDEYVHSRHERNRTEVRVCRATLPLRSCEESTQRAAVCSRREPQRLELQN